MLCVAEWYKLDPETVFRWPMPHYTDREEFMRIRIHQNNPPEKPDPDGLKPGEIPYKGRQKDV